MFFKATACPATPGALRFPPEGDNGFTSLPASVRKIEDGYTECAALGSNSRLITFKDGGEAKFSAILGFIQANFPENDWTQDHNYAISIGKHQVNLKSNLNKLECQPDILTINLGNFDVKNDNSVKLFI